MSSTQPPPAWDRRSLISACIILHTLAMFFWSQPWNYFPRRVVNEVTGGYMRLLGTWQNWDMFSPRPRSIKVRMDATVTFRDGTTTTWEFPQMDRLSLFARFQKERFRKWAHDSVRTDDESRLWRPTARYIARLHANPDNPPVRVQLTRYWSEIPPPTSSGQIDENLPVHRYTFYDTTIGPEQP